MRAFQFRRTQRKYKSKCRVTNWQRYESGLRRRGAITLWIGRDARRNWCHLGRRRPGGQRVYSDAAIETFWTVAMIYRLPLRQTEDFIQSVFEMARIRLPVPDHTTVSRRFRRLRRRPMLPRVGGEAIHLVVDTTGLTIHVGNEELPRERRGWRKIHLAVERDAGIVLADDLTPSSTRDPARIRTLLAQVRSPLPSLCADSAYDRFGVYNAALRHSGASRIIIPPRRHAKLDLGRRPPLQQRDEHIWQMRQFGRRRWYLESGWTKRSRVENVIYRYKRCLGPAMKPGQWPGNASKRGSVVAS